MSKLTLELQTIIMSEMEDVKRDAARLEAVGEDIVWQRNESMSTLRKLRD